MKPIKILKKEGGDKNLLEGVNMIKVHFIHKWKYYNETPLYN
jgi:hypothetical protein